MNEHTVFVVDDDPAILRAIERVLRARNYQVALYEGAARFLEATNAAIPGCLLLDLAMPELSGLEVQERLRALGDERPIIFLSGQGSVGTSVRAMKGGAIDFLEKPCDDVQLLSSVERALQYDDRLRAERERRELVRRRLGLLTPRESEVFRHIIAGRLNKQIAAKLGTAEKTVTVHRARVMNKMSVRSVAELTRIADFMGVLPAI
jgi:FixJ family two-component response regulator